MACQLVIEARLPFIGLEAPAKAAQRKNIQLKRILMCKSKKRRRENPW